MKLKHLPRNILLLLAIIGAEISYPFIAWAVNVSVPAAVSSGYMLVSTTTGNYIATTTDPAHFGSIFATSTTATSYFAGNVNILGTCTGCGSGGSGTISTSSPLTSGQPLYATGVNTIASVASSTFLTSIGGITLGSLGATYPIVDTSGTFSLSGMATSSPTNGTGISLSGTGSVVGGSLQITNSAPDQTVVLNNGTSINVTGTYPNFTINNTAPLTFAYPFPLQLGGGNATSSLTAFSGGILSTASSTIVSTTFLASGLVGIGTSTPLRTLTIANDERYSQIGLVDLAGTSGNKIGTIGYINGVFKFNTLADNYASTTRMTIDDNGRVGIATSSPYAALSVNGKIAGTVLSIDGTIATSVISSPLSVSGNFILPSLASGLLKGNGASAVSIASNGTDFTLVTAQSCAAGSFVSALTASGGSTCTAGNAGTVTAVTGTWPIISSGGATPNLTWGGLATSSPIAAASGFFYATGVNTFASVATSSPIQMSITGNAGTVTNGVYTTGAGSVYEVPLTFNYPLTRSVNAISFPATSTLYGTGTNGQVLMWSGSAPVWAATSTSSGSGLPFSFLPTTNYGATANSTSTPIWFTAGIMASTTANYFQGLTIDNALAGDALTQYGATSHEWSVGAKISDFTFRISSSTSLGTSDAFTIDKNLLVTIPTSLKVASLAGLGGWNAGVAYAIATSSAVFMDITGNAGTVTNGVYTTTFNNLFDVRLTATTSLPQIATLNGLTKINTYSGLFAGNAGNLFQVATSTLTPTAPLGGSFTQIGSGGTLTCTGCLTGNQSITLSGVVTGTGATAITTSFGSQTAGVLGNAVTGNTAPMATSTLYGAGAYGQVLMNNSGLKLTATSTLFTYPWSVANGGTGWASIAAGTLMIGNGTSAISTTSLSSAFSNSNGTLSAIQPASFQYATSTTWTGTTTVMLEISYGEVFSSIRCATNAGTVNVDVYHGSSHLNLLSASTTVGVFSFSTNNTMTDGDLTQIDIGTPASSPKKVVCTIKKTY